MCNRDGRDRQTPHVDRSEVAILPVDSLGCREYVEPCPTLRRREVELFPIGNERERVPPGESVEREATFVVRLGQEPKDSRVMPDLSVGAHEGAQQRETIDEV